jgi:cytochrome c biogenesis protein CcmG/thiol:disulfide interchange protein DsbE
MMKILLASLAAVAMTGSFQDSKDYGKRPDWTMTLPDGKKVSAADYDGKVLILDFWATWCPPCRKEVPGFIKLQKQYADKGLVIVGFSFDRDAETHDKWVKEQGMNYLSIFAMNDAGKGVIDQFQKLIGEIKGIPTAIIIDKKGQIIHKHVGYGDPEEFEKIFKPLL